MHWKNRRLDFGSHTYVMGIINCTPDSFYTGSRNTVLAGALETAEDMEAAGVNIIDIGGESSRPGAEPVPVAEELERVIPVIKGIRETSEILISIDTCKKEVAEAAIEAGADMVNDIYALRNNPELAAFIAKSGVPVVLMHMRGTPGNMQKNPYYEDTNREIIAELTKSVAYAEKNGISRDLLIIDPGIGFGKRLEDNLRIIGGLQAYRALNLPILMGLSRKAFIGAVTGKKVDNRLPGTIAANTMAIINGAEIVRVHDYREAVDMVKMIEAVRGAR